MPHTTVKSVVVGNSSAVLYGISSAGIRVRVRMLKGRESNAETVYMAITYVWSGI